MEQGGDWGLPDDSPLQGVRFLLDFGDARCGVAVDMGRIVFLGEMAERDRKRDFLANVRIGRNLFIHPRIC